MRKFIDVKEHPAPGICPACLEEKPFFIFEEGGGTMLYCEHTMTAAILHHGAACWAAYSPVTRDQVEASVKRGNEAAAKLEAHKATVMPRHGAAFVPWDS